MLQVVWFGPTGVLPFSEYAHRPSLLLQESVGDRRGRSTPDAKPPVSSSLVWHILGLLVVP